MLPTRVTMHSAMMQPIKAVEEKTAANLTVLQPTEGQPTRYVYDFGQEFAGVVRLSLPAALPAGVNVTIKHAEALSHPPIGPRDGSAFMGNLYWAHPVDYYMTKGSSEPEDYQPSFTYQYAPTRAIATYLVVTILSSGVLYADQVVWAQWIPVLEPGWNYRPESVEKD